MDASAVVTPPYLASPLRLTPFRALYLEPRRVGDPATARMFSRPQRSAAAKIEQWRSRGVLRQHDTPALYLHEYSAEGLTVRGLVGVLDITRRASRVEDRCVLPHEGIHPQQADELADRMTELRINPAPILLVHRARAELRALLAGIAEGPAERAFEDRRGQRHRVWPIRDAATIEQISAHLADARALIADGHHRYAAYLRMQQRAPGGSADGGLAMVVDHDDTPFFLGPIHRVLHGTSLDDLTTAARTTGAVVERCRRREALDQLAHHTLVVTDGEEWATLRLPEVPGRAPVSQLHDELLPELPRGPRSIEYQHRVDRVLRDVGRGSGRVAVLMPAPGARLVLELAQSGRLLPEKATSFHPKPNTGVLMRSLEQG